MAFGNNKSFQLIYFNLYVYSLRNVWCWNYVIASLHSTRNMVIYIDFNDVIKVIRATDNFPFEGHVAF